VICYLKDKQWLFKQDENEEAPTRTLVEYTVVDVFDLHINEKDLVN